jgi:cyclic pyranopterin phosphate synthase
VKLNAVIIRGYNDDEVVDLARLAHDEQLIVRFIEYMPFDGKRLWDVQKVFTGREIVARIREHYPLEELPREAASTALNYRFRDSNGMVGLITSISAPFCGDCDRIRLKADGHLVPCMFDNTEFDLKAGLRGGASDDEIAEYIRNCVRHKAPGVETLIKELVPLQHVRPMHTIGG